MRFLELAKFFASVDEIMKLEGGWAMVVVYGGSGE